MQVNFPATIRQLPVLIEPIRGKKISQAAREAIVAAFPDNAEAVLAEVARILASIGYASASRMQIANAVIEQSGKKVMVSRAVEEQPGATIEVATLKEACAAAKARYNCDVAACQAGRHDRTADGRQLTATLVTNRGARLATVI